MLTLIGTPFVFAILLAVLTAAVTWPLNVALYKRSTGYAYSVLVEQANRQAVHVAVDYITMGRAVDISNDVLENVISAACIENKAHREDVYDLNQLKSVLVQVFIHNHLLDEPFKHTVITTLCQDNAVSGKEKYYPTPSYTMARRMAFLMTTVSVLLSLVITTVVTLAYQDVRYLLNERATTVLGLLTLAVLAAAEWLMYLAMRPAVSHKRGVLPVKPAPPSHPEQQ